MHDAPAHLLLVEDDDAYAALVAAELASASAPFTLHRASTLRDAECVLARSRIDAVLLDLGLPDCTGLVTVDRVLAAAPDMPIVVLTANDEPALAVSAVQRGAQDYLVKGGADVHALWRTIRYARERAGLRRELRQREARFRALVEHGHDVILLLDRDGTCLFASRSLERSGGYTPAEVLGRRLDTLTHPEDMVTMRVAYAECLANPGKNLPLEFRYLHKDGAWRYAEAQIVNCLEDAAVGAIVINHRDITSRKVAEESLRETEAELRQAHKMEAVGRLAGGVAHDFNNVLTAIFGYADLLLDQFAEDDPRRSDLEEIRRSAERAASLTRQLLAFSRKQIMQPRVLDLNEVVAGMQNLLARLVSEDITVQLDLQPRLWPVRADPGQIEQVLMNLAANGRDAMPEGGRLTLATSTSEIGEELGRTLPGLAPGSYVTLSVSDTGHGIAPEIQRHLFEPFFTTKQIGKGTGLGLATVYGIVKQTGGGIYLESEVGKGTRFTVYLPRVP